MPVVGERRHGGLSESVVVDGLIVCGWDPGLSESAAIILAAGKSTRMNSDLPKVLHELCGQPMLRFVLGACGLAGVDRTLVVVGHDKHRVIERFSESDGIEWIVQDEQKGTGHAVQCCREALGGFEGSVLVVAGDMPLVQRATFASLLESRIQSGDAVTMATTVLDDPTGYGRIVRDDDGQLVGIVEHVDCTADQREICEVNPSYYCFDAGKLFSSLAKVKPTGAKGEYYLTDVIRLLRESGEGVSAPISVAPEEAMGVNSRLDLAVVSRLMQDRIQLRLMNDGVTIVDPDNTWIEADVTIGRDTVVCPFSVIEAGAVIGDGCRVESFSRVTRNRNVSDGSRVPAAACEGVTD